MTNYSFNIYPLGHTGETSFCVLGVLVGVVISWFLRDLVILLGFGSDPLLVEGGLYIGGLLMISLLVVVPTAYVKTYKWCIMVVSSIGIVIYANVLETSWLSPEANYFQIAGLLPSSDAQGWLWGGWRLLEFEALSTYDSRRPINSALYAFSLFVTGDLQRSILLVGLVAGVVSIFASMAVKISFGWLSAVAFVYCCLELIQEHLSLTMTEVHGFIFGCLAFGILWRAATNHSLSAFLVGLLLLAVALSARSGPMFVLPVLLIWGLWTFGVDRRSLIVVLIGGLFALSGGVVISKIFHSLWGSAENFQNANLSLTLYGMTVGGKGWTQALIDYPHLWGSGSQDEVAVAKKIYSLAIKEFVEEPSRFFNYYVSELKEFINLFLKYDLGVSRIALVVSSIWLAMRWRDRVAQLIMIICIGILISAPFLMDDAGVRPFSPVYPVFAAVPAISIGLFSRWVSLKLRPELTWLMYEPRLPKNAVAVGILAILLALSGPIISVLMYKPQIIPQSICTPDEEKIGLSTYTGAFVHVVADDIESVVRIPKIRHRDFLMVFPDSQPQSGKAQLADLVPPFTFVATLGRYFVMDGLVELASRNSLPVCVGTSMGNQGYNTGYVSVRKNKESRPSGD